MRLYALATGVLTTILMAAPVLSQAKQGVPGGPTSSWGSIVPMMLIMFAIIYFLMIRPEQKKQKDRNSMMSGLKKGDKVVTIGGMMGVVQSVKDTTVNIRVADNTTIEFTKVAVATIMKEGNDKAATTEKTAAIEKTAIESKETKGKK